MNKSNQIRVMLVDDYDLVRSGLKVFIEAFDDLELVGEAVNGKDALDQCENLMPDIILMDLMMPVMDGITAIQEATDRYPPIKIIALTSYGEEDLVQHALNAGASSFLYKDASIYDLADAIRKTHAGDPVLAPKAARYLIDAAKKPRIPNEPLSAREKEVLVLMVEGLTNTGIAKELVIGRSTVKTHVSHILAKLSVTNRQEAITMALRHKLVT